MPRTVTCNRIDTITTSIQSQRLLVIARRGEAERAGQTDVVAALTAALGHIDQAVEAMERAASLAPIPME
jgi:hypothetical protein